MATMASPASHQLLHGFVSALLGDIQTSFDGGEGRHMATDSGGAYIQLVPPKADQGDGAQLDGCGLENLTHRSREWLPGAADLAVVVCTRCGDTLPIMAVPSQW